jgi:tRNA pseudouridine55 synthase
MIIPFYKRYGQSTHQLAHAVGLIHHEKATHTGTLDPAAEGVVVVLTGEDRFKKQELAGAQKTYLAQILCGISTDTFDLIGYPDEKVSEPFCIGVYEIEKSLQSLVGSYAQTQPAFSAKRVDGKSYFDLAKQGIEPADYKNVVTIYSIDLLSSDSVSISNVQKYHASRLKLIEGDFRQTEIANQWHQLFQALAVSSISELPLLTISVTCSKRTYIRALVRDVSEKLGVPAVLYSLVRTANGPYSITDCLCLVPPSAAWRMTAERSPAEGL